LDASLLLFSIDPVNDHKSQYRNDNQRRYMMIIGKPFRRLTILGLSIFLLASCGKPQQQTSSSVTILIGEDPPSFNAAVGDTGYDSLVMHMVMMGLTDIDPEGNIIPRLAAELPTLDNGRVLVDDAAGTMDVTWTLREDVNWTDGTPVTSDDVIFTYDAILDPETGGWIMGIDYVDGIEKIDAKTFVIHFNTIYPGYLTFFGGEQVVIWPKHYCDPEQGFVAWDCGRKPLSNGPYLLEEWVTGDHLSFVRNPNYFISGKPQIERVLVRVIPDVTVRETMMRQGDADVLMWATEQVADDLKNEPNVAISFSPNNRWVMRLFMNLAAKGSTDPATDPNPFLSDIRVRQAIRSAVDVDTIINSVWHGFPKPVWTEFFRAPYACNIPRPTFDPERSKALLAEAGWIDQDGDGTRECIGCQTAPEGTPMNMELITYAEYGEPLELTQQLIGEMLGTVGIHLELSIVQGSVLWADYQSGGIEQRGDFNIDLWDDGYSGTDPTDFLQQSYSTDAAVPDQGYNFGRWSNPEFDTLLYETYTLDETQRKVNFCQMAQLLEDDLPQILMFSTINADAYSTRLSGIQSNINSIVTWNISDWTIIK
jgi:peptide/nickel transport system substrate-binding protein